MESSVEKHSDHLSGSHSSCPSEHRVRARAMLTPEQYTALSSLWAETQFPTTHQRVELAERISMRPRTVQVWFQNQRQKTKRQSILAESAPNSAHHAAANNEQTYSTHSPHSSQSSVYGTYSYHHSVAVPAAPHHSISTPSSHPLSSMSIYNPSGHAFSAPVESAFPHPLPPLKDSVTAPPIDIDVIVCPPDRKSSYFSAPGTAPEPDRRAWDSQNRPSPSFDTQAQWSPQFGKTSRPDERPVHHPVPSSSSLPIGNSPMLHRSQSTYPYPPWGPPSPVRRQSLGHYHPYDSSINKNLRSVRRSSDEFAKTRQSQLTRRPELVSSSASTTFPKIPTSYPVISNFSSPMPVSASEPISEVPNFKSSSSTTTVLNASSVNQSPASMKLPSFREFLQSTVSPEDDVSDPIQTPLAESKVQTLPSPSPSSPSSASFAPPIPVSARIYTSHSFGSRAEYISRR